MEQEDEVVSVSGIIEPLTSVQKFARFFDLSSYLLIYVVSHIVIAQQVLQGMLRTLGDMPGISLKDWASAANHHHPTGRAFTEDDILAILLGEEGYVEESLGVRFDGGLGLVVRK